MIAEIIECHLQMITEFMERREPVPKQLIENVRRAVNLVAEEVPKDKLNAFLNALDKLPTQ